MRFLFGKDRKRELELEVIAAVRELCKSEPRTTNEEIHVTNVRAKAEPLGEMLGWEMCQ